MKLLNGVDTPVRAGVHVFIFTANGGTGSLDSAIGDSGSQQVKDASWTANANGTVLLPTGTATATLTGNSTLHLSPLTV